MESREESIRRWRRGQTLEQAGQTVCRALRTLALALAPLALFFPLYYAAPDKTLYGAGYGSWAIFASVSVCVWAAASLLVALAKHLLFPSLIAMQSIKDEHIFVFRGLYTSIVYVVWSVTELVVWFAYFAANPFSNGLAFDWTAAHWITDLIIASIFLALLILAKSVILLLSSYRRRTEVYYERVKSTLSVGLILEKLTENIPVELMRSESGLPLRRATDLLTGLFSNPLKRAGARTTESEHNMSSSSSHETTGSESVVSALRTAASLPNLQRRVLFADSAHQNAAHIHVSVSADNLPNQESLVDHDDEEEEDHGLQVPLMRPSQASSKPEGESLEAALEGFQMQWKKFDLDASFIEHSFLSMCNGQVLIKSDTDADSAASAIFKHFTRATSSTNSQPHTAAKNAGPAVPVKFETALSSFPTSSTDNGPPASAPTQSETRTEPSPPLSTAAPTVSSSGRPVKASPLANVTVSSAGPFAPRQSGSASPPLIRRQAAAHPTAAHHEHQAQTVYLTKASLRALLTDDTLVEAGWHVLDPTLAERLSEKQLKQRLSHLYNERKHLASSLQSVDNIFSAAGVIFNCFIGFCMFLFFMFVFSNTAVGQVLLSFSTLFLGLSFTFGEAAKNIFCSFLFIFVHYVYDVGDRVLIAAINDQPMFVRQINLLSTIFQVWDNKHLVVPNHILYNTSIINVRRSTNMSDELFLDVDARTSAETIVQLEHQLKDFLRSRPSEYDHTHSSVRVLSLDHLSCLRLRIVIAQHGNWQKGEFYSRRHDCLMHIKRVCDDLGVMQSACASAPSTSPLHPPKK
eukprot:m.662841 g.662841  ORF g.662841 m.662841 type:complete len:804 (-) comp58480_c0_seq4:90-2501(-)